MRLGRLLIAIPICFVMFGAVFVLIIGSSLGDCEANGEVVGCDRGVLGLLMFPGSFIVAATVIFLFARWVRRRDEASE